MAVYTFVKDTVTNNIYTFNGTTWVNTGFSEPLTKANFTASGITNVLSITQAQWSTLVSQEIDLITWSDSPSIEAIVDTPNTYKITDLLDNPSVLSCVGKDTTPQLTMSVNAITRVRYLVSTDNRATWQAFNGSGFVNVNLSDISTGGMTRAQLQNITSSQWNTWFAQPCLDFAVYVYSQNPNGSNSAVRKISVNFPNNAPPLVGGITFTPNPTNRGSVNLNFVMRDLEGDKFKYKLLVNGQMLLDWSDWFSAGTIANITKTFDYTIFQTGTNTLEIQVIDDRGATTSYFSTCQLNNTTPIVSTFTYNNWSLSGVINDADGDMVAYRIKINNRQVYPYVEDFTQPTYTPFYTIPCNVSYEWDSTDLIYGITTNKVELEVIDSVGGIATYPIYNIVGKNKNLMFKDPYNKYYTDSHGNVLNGNYINIGSVAEGEYSQIQRILLENSYGYGLSNVHVTVDNSQYSGFQVELSKDNTFIPGSGDSLQSLTFNGIMPDNDVREVYVRVKADNVLTVPPSKQFKISADGTK